MATANAPVIRIEPEFRPMTADGEPSTHIATEGRSKIAFTMANKGHSSTNIMNASLEIKAPFVEVENPQLQMEGMAPNETKSLTFELNTTPNDITGAWLQSHIAVQHLENCIWLDTIVQYGGIFENFESDTLNPLFQWGGYWSYCDEDAYEGSRCYISRIEQSGFQGRFLAPLETHHSKISFHYKTHDQEQQTLVFKFLHGDETYLSSEEWQYVEFEPENIHNTFRFTHHPYGDLQSKIDNICFPPMHTAIAYAGKDIIACTETSIVPIEAYAYDCDDILWTTDGDGHFDNDTVDVPIYHPGSQDIMNGIVTLTLTAYGNDTIVSTTHIRFVDEVSLGEIAGDSVVNKYNDPISHYSIENPEGMQHSWYLEPTSAGIIYGFGDAIDILWNQHEGDAEATLWAWANNGCESVSKHISLIGYSTPEWHPADFSLFPNPTDGKINLVIGETLQGKGVVEVYNLLGERMMIKKTGQLQKGEAISLDLSRFVSGLYIIKLSTENGTCSKKVSVR